MFQIITTIVLLAISFGNALTYKANSGSRDDVQMAINKTKSGDTVFIPAGNFVFNGGINLKAGITIKGAGRDKTTLRRTSSGGSWMFTVDCSNGGQLVITGLTIIGLSPNMSPGIKLINDCQDFRIYDNTFRKCYDRAIETHGNTRGVIDHNVFINNNLASIVVIGDADKTWQKKIQFGSQDAVYVEDNYFRQDTIASSNMHHHIASNNGSRYVFRYNECDDGDLSSSAADAHGNKNYWPRGSRTYEIYNNSFKSIRRWVCVNIRGGDGVIFGNKFSGSYSYPIQILFESDNMNCSYPCIDQITKLYLWNNTYDGKSFQIRNRHPDIIKLDRDYFLKEMPDYVPYTYPHPLTVNSSATATKVIAQNTERQTQITPVIGYINYISKNDIIEGKFSSELSGQKLNFKLFDAQGKLVREISTNASMNGQFRLSLNSNNNRLPNGIYTIVFNSNGLRLQKSLIVSR